MKRLLSLITLFLLIALALGFTVLNAGPVDLDFYLGRFSVPLALVVVLAVLVGAVLGMLVSMGVVLRQRRQAKRLQRQLDTAETEVRNLRQIPLRDRH